MEHILTNEQARQIEIEAAESPAVQDDNFIVFIDGETKRIFVSATIPGACLCMDKRKAQLLVDILTDQIRLL